MLLHEEMAVENLTQADWVTIINERVTADFISFSFTQSNQ